MMSDDITLAPERLLVGAMHLSRVGFKVNSCQFLTMSYFLEEIYCTQISKGTNLGSLAGTC